MLTYNTINSHTDHLKIRKRDSEETLLTFVNPFPRKWRLLFLYQVIVIPVVVRLQFVCLFVPFVILRPKSTAR